MLLKVYPVVEVSENVFSCVPYLLKEVHVSRSKAPGLVSVTLQRADGHLSSTLRRHRHQEHGVVHQSCVSLWQEYTETGLQIFSDEIITRCRSATITLSFHFCRLLTGTFSTTRLPNYQPTFVTRQSRVCSSLVNFITVMTPSMSPPSCLGPWSLSMAHLSKVEATRGSSTLSSLKPVMLTPL